MCTIHVERLCHHGTDTWVLLVVRLYFTRRCSSTPVPPPVTTNTMPSTLNRVSRPRVAEDVAADPSGDLTRFFFFFGKDDHWVSSHHRDVFLRQRAEHASRPGYGRGRTKAVVDEGNLPHAFCIRKFLTEDLRRSPCGINSDIIQTTAKRWRRRSNSGSMR